MFMPTRLVAPSKLTADDPTFPVPQLVPLKRNAVWLFPELSLALLPEPSSKFQ